MLMLKSPLLLTLLLPLVGALCCGLFIPPREGAVQVRLARKVALLFMSLTLVAALMMLANFNAGDGGFQQRLDVPWIPAIGVSFGLAVDGISLWLIVLTALLGPIVILASYKSITERAKEYYVLMLLLQSGMLGVFMATDLLLFYVCFELTLIPLYFIIGIWGGPEKLWAARKFFIYTLAGSVITFTGVLYLGYAYWADQGNLNFSILELYSLAQSGALSRGEQTWLFLAFFAGFAIKVPLFPFHTWLPLAHVEAPTAGSVVLAGVLLKLGTYGFLRLTLPMLPLAAQALAPTMAVVAIIGVIYAALIAWVQQDIKRLIAYSSVSHLGMCMLGMFALNQTGVTGSVLYLGNHGIRTGALFLLVGMVYDRYHTRSLGAYSGLARQMPWWAFFMILFTLSSIGLPGLNGFVSEILVLVGVFTSGRLGIPYAAVAATGMVLGALYMLWLCQKVVFGPLELPEVHGHELEDLGRDLNLREIGLLCPLALAVVILGVYPKPVLQTMDGSVTLLIEQATVELAEDQSESMDLKVTLPVVGLQAEPGSARLTAAALPADDTDPAVIANPITVGRME